MSIGVHKTFEGRGKERGREAKEGEETAETEKENRLIRYKRKEAETQSNLPSLVTSLTFLFFKVDSFHYAQSRERLKVTHILGIGSI